MRMRTLKVSGTPYEQGVQQGRACGDQIRANLLQIVRLTDSLNRGDPAWYDRLVRMNSGYVESIDPGTLEEIEGIASGSGIAVDDLLRMNFPVYMILRRTKVVEECSVFAVAAAASSEGVTYLVKTRDQDVSQFQFEHVMLWREYGDGSRIVEVNGAGIITNPGSGMNNRGFAVGTAGAWSRQRIEVNISRLGEAYAMPDMHHLLRNAGSVAEAREVLGEQPRLAGMNLVVADGTGELGTLELTADCAYYTPSANGYSHITNHYLHPEITGMNDLPSEYPSTYARYRRIDEVLGQRVPKASFRDMLRLLMDESDGPQDSVCRSTDGPEGSVTRYASVSVVEEFETWAMDGLPTTMAAIASPEAVRGWAR